MTPEAAGLAPLEESVAAFESAQEIYLRETHPARWADIHRSLAYTYEAIGNRYSGRATRHYRTALQHVDQALEVPRSGQKHDIFEDAQSLRERLIAKLAAS